MKRQRHRAELVSAVVVLFAFAAVATVGPPRGWVDRRPQVCGMTLVQDCFGGPTPVAWDQAPTIWFVLAGAVTLVIAIWLWLAPMQDDPSSDIRRR